MGYKLKRILIYPDGVTEKQVYPATGWKPDASRTILYYDFEQNLNDLSGNNNNPIASSGIGYEQVGGQYVLTNTTNTPYIQLSPSYGNNLTDFTVSFWVYPKYISGQGDVLLFSTWYTGSASGPFNGPAIFVLSGGNAFVRVSSANPKQPFAFTRDAWQYITFTRISGTCKIYKNAVSQLSWTDATSWNSGDFYVFSRNLSNQQFKAIGAKMDKLIYENVGWSDAETTDYYNLTKSTYGL